MKDKIIAELEKKYTGRLSKKLIEEIAERLSTKVKDEQEIEGVIKSELEDSIIKVGDLQAEGDRRATELQTKFTKTKSEIEAEKQSIKDELEELKKDPGPDDDLSDNNKIKKLEDRLVAFEQKEKEREVRAVLEDRAKAKKIPSQLYKRVQIKSVDEVEAIVSDLEKEVQEIRQAWIEEKVVGKPPERGSETPGGDEQVIDDIKTFSKKIK